LAGKGHRRVSNPIREEAVKTEKGSDTFGKGVAEEHSP
jgi:hypothetical protein